jgi:Protein of unknown function (DUF995)
MRAAVAACVAASTLYAADCVEAGNVELPPEVRPLTQQETVNVYSGKTINYPGFSYYFGPDNYLVGITKDHRSLGRGTWAVNDNTICLRSTWHSSGTTKSFRYDVCYAWYANNAAYWIKITTGRLSGSVYKGDPSLVANGDQVSELVGKASHRYFSQRGRR